MKGKILKWILGIISVLVVLCIINFCPTLSLKTRGMKKLEGNWIDVYYETEAEAAKDVFSYAEEHVADIARSLGFVEKPDVRVYIYDSQGTMQTKKYGFVAPLLGLNWYIGDNIGTNVILTSPANPGKAHSYDNNKYASLHEIVHAYVSVLNKDVALWLTEVCSNSPLTFADCGGYTYAHIYIEYIDVIYGWDAVLKLIQSEDYEKVLGKSRRERYDEWVMYIEGYYR